MLIFYFFFPNGKFGGNPFIDPRPGSFTGKAPDFGFNKFAAEAISSGPACPCCPGIPPPH